MYKTLTTIFVLSFSGLSQGAFEFDHGEVKITYPCSVIDSLTLRKEEKEEITFYETPKNELIKAGYIWRKRVNKMTGEADFTVKYRSDNPFVPATQERMKCEFDANYKTNGHSISYACSFKSETDKPLPQHEGFIKLLGKPSPRKLSDLSSMKEAKLDAVSWKLKLTKAQKQLSPFKKKLSVEKWTLKDGSCRVEISGRIDQKSISKGISFIRSLIKTPPAAQQGSKTEWVLKGI